MHPDLSASLAAAWRSRASGEARVGRGFARLAAALPDGEALPLVRERLLAAAAEEARHATLCERMASRYGGAPPADPFPDEPLPLDTELGRLLVLVTACCISECLASAYLERCLARASEPHVTELLHQLLRDEVGHAQLGWAHLASLPPSSPLRVELRRAAPLLIERTRKAWHDRIRVLHARPSPEHGYPPADECTGVIDEAVEQLVVAGFRHVGVDL